VLVGLLAAPDPVVEAVAGDAGPGDEPAQGQLSALVPMQEESDDGIALLR
jgi:hypothetical protein